MSAQPTTHGDAELRQLESDAAAWHERGAKDVGLLDRDQLREAGSLTSDAVLSDVAKSYVAASKAAVKGHWLPGRGAIGKAAAIGLILALMATPIIGLLIVALSAWVIHRLGR